jgi:hypothetical protein
LELWFLEPAARVQFAARSRKTEDEKCSLCNLVDVAPRGAELPRLRNWQSAFH